MKNVVNKTSHKNENSPKTPGGISKSHLTPIRRLGLSRNVRKTGPSPFISPLSGSNNVSKSTTPTINDKRKRKEPVEDETSEEEVKAVADISKKDGLLNIDESDEISLDSRTESIVATPTRTVSVPRKKKSKILKSDVETDCDSILEKPVASPMKTENKVHSSMHSKSISKVTNEPDDIIERYIEVAKPKKTKSRSKKNTKGKELNETITDSLQVKVEVHIEASPKEEEAVKALPKKSPQKKEKSPKELTKECIVVLQKKIFKNELNKDQVSGNRKDTSAPSQVLFDSDSDEVPLSSLNKKNILPTEDETNLATIIEDDDFMEPKIRVKKLENKTTSTTGLKTNKKLAKSSLKNVKPKSDNCTQISKNIDMPGDTFHDDDDDDDDFVVGNKRTILIRKTYDKVIKPSRARSTGSITQKDIDELKARIEMKKKLLMAKAINNDTKELRELIKKWQKGCQDALTELMDLMKMKFPDKRNMDYSEILETLKIPANLVGYDSDNDCFVTPTDENIILSKLNDM